MKKTKLFAMMSVILAMGLAACGGNKSSAEPAKSSSEPAPSSQVQPSSEPSAPSTSAPTPSPSAPTPSSSSSARPSSSTQPSSSAQPSSSSTPSSQPSSSAQPSSSSEPASTSSAPVDNRQMTANGIDIVVENEKVYAKITGTISGFENADAMKMAFGLITEAQQGQTQTYIYGSATPADEDYKLVPTVDDAGAFEVKADLSDVQWVGGTFTAMIGPKDFYKAVASQGGTYGTGKSVVGGYRISVRSHNGTIAADQLPPIALTISRMEIDGDKIYHVIGGALNTDVLSEEAFLAKKPYVQYEATTVGWSKNVMGSSTKTDLVSVAVDESGNALIKTNVTSLGANGYNIKINLNEDKDVDTKMDAIIDETENPTAFGMYDYVPYADSTQTDKAHLYGNCGLFINAANRYVNAGDKIADLQPVQSKENEVAYEMAAADCDGQNAPVYGSQDPQKNTRLGKGGVYSDVWDITGIRSGEYEVYIKGSYSSGNGTSYWSGAQNVELNNDKESNNGSPYNSGARYKVGIDTNDTVDLASTKTYADCGLGGDANGGWTNVAMAKVMIPEGSKSFTLTNNNNGYAIWVYAVRIVRVGNWTKPVTPVAFTDGAMKIEAEGFHESSADINPKTEDGVTFITPPPTNWPQFNASYKINCGEAIQVKLKLRFNWTAYSSGAYGVAELTVDGGSKIHNASPDSENLTSASGEVTNAWEFTESAPFDLAAGDHTIKLQIPYGCTVNWDYFELIIVA